MVSYKYDEAIQTAEMLLKSIENNKKDRTKRQEDSQIKNE